MEKATKTLINRVGNIISVPLPPDHLGLNWVYPDKEQMRQAIRLVEDTEKETVPARATGADQLEELFAWIAQREKADCLVGVDKTGKVQAFGAVSLYPNEIQVARADLFAVTSSKWQGRGIGRSLLKWQDLRARNLLLEHYGKDCALPARIRNVVDSKQVDRRMLYAAAGFSCRHTIRVFSLNLLAPKGIPYEPLASGTELVEISNLQAPIWEHIETLHAMNSRRVLASVAEAQRWLERVKDRFDPRFSFALWDQKTARVLAYVFAYVRQELKNDGEAGSNPSADTLSIELIGTDRQSGIFALAPLLNEIREKALQAGFKQIMAEDNNPSNGEISAALHNAGYENKGARMIYTVEL